MTNHKCYVCGSADEELRPYGLNAALICFDCMSSDKDREAEAFRQFTNQVIAADRGIGSIVLIGEETGPRPMIKGDN